MTEPSSIAEYVQALKASPGLSDQVVHHEILAPEPAAYGRQEGAWPEAVRRAMAGIGIDRFYHHQIEAMDRIRSGDHVVVATPTASGKSLIYQLPILEKLCGDAEARALYLAPLKALAQDQMNAFQRLGRHFSQPPPSVAVYDGDTSAWHRGKIRATPPTLLMSNPDMVHLALLPHHHQWKLFFTHLKMVVIDEVHTCRGLMGSHMAQVFRRLQRICQVYGASPTFVCCSATVSNPAQLVNQLTGLDAVAVSRSGAPRGRRHVVFVNPVDGPVQAAISLLKAALHRGLRTIVYTQSRKLTELMAMWVSTRAGAFAHRISAYRAGFLPEERRQIEARLASGDLLAVISTSALELGIDIGDLDLCILVGYPGSVVATWQRSGRTGRAGQESALVLVAGEDALDQYVMRHPKVFLEKGPEAAVANPHNMEVMSRHLVCAAAEQPLCDDEPMVTPVPVMQAIKALEQAGELLRSEDGRKWYAARMHPHRHVDLRGAGVRFTVVCKDTGRSLGEVDGFRAFRETHPGAVYLHRGRTYLVDELDTENRKAMVTETRIDYYTRVRSVKETEILSTEAQKRVGATRVCLGALRVTEQITGYERVRLDRRQKLNVLPLDLPPLVFETEGLWFAAPRNIESEIEARQLHFMGAIHAVEHAAIGVFPLLVMADRNDLGGISTPFHGQLGQAAVFIYDGIPGGGGLCREGFEKAQALLRHTHSVVHDCGCDTGCPACVHSPKCGSGNRPIDKAAAAALLDLLIREDRSEVAGTGRQDLAPGGRAEWPAAVGAGQIDGAGGGKETPRPSCVGGVGKQKKGAGGRAASRRQRRARRLTGDDRSYRASVPRVSAPSSERHYVVFDIETQRSAQEVGGWHRADLMGISCVVLYDSKTDAYETYLETQAADLIQRLREADLVVGFNICKFDYHVLKGYTDFDFAALPTLDLLANIHERLGYRLSLQRLAMATLGAKKTADGLQALRWWQQGRVDEIVAYCREDVRLTRNLYLHGREKGFLLFDNKAGQRVRVPVDFRKHSQGTASALFPGI
ncbi:MAG: DEAD/DEAH box helicase [Desulfobacterales bacterium]|nr:DEAD/DEAH box helicase [Desulfobacterales bacterium]